MGFLEKVKGFFYDEEEVEEEIVPKKVKPKEHIRKEHKIQKPSAQEDVTERELFRAERTFNFPMDIEDDEEPDFVPVKPKIVESKEEPRSVEPPRTRYVESNSYSSIGVRETHSASRSANTIEKKFTPTPIISPIYGVMDGSLKTSEPSSIPKPRSLSETKKIDFDTVRKKAYGEIHTDEEEEEDNKGLFYNLSNKEEVEEENVIPVEQMVSNEEASPSEPEEDNIKITYNDVDYDEEEENTTEEKELEKEIDEANIEETEEDDDEEIEIPKIARLRRSKNKDLEEQDEEDAIMSDTKEQDLFNLIDNMYNSDEEEGEEE